MLGNARVVPRLQNLATYKQLVENRHRFFCHETQAGIVLNKKPKFSPDDVVISFAMEKEGLYYFEENLPEEKAKKKILERLKSDVLQGKQDFPARLKSQLNGFSR